MRTTTIHPATGLAACLAAWALALGGPARADEDEAQVLSENAAPALSGNQTEVLSGNAPRCLSDNTTELLSGNETHMLSENTCPLLSGNTLNFFSGIKIILHFTNEEGPTIKPPKPGGAGAARPETCGFETELFPEEADELEEDEVEKDQLEEDESMLEEIAPATEPDESVEQAGSADSAQRFEQLDVNGDGVLSLAEYLGAGLPENVASR